MPFEQKWGYAAEDRLFIDAVLGERAPAVTALDGYRATELVDACYRAVRDRLKLPITIVHAGEAIHSCGFAVASFTPLSFAASSP